MTSKRIQTFTGNTVEYKVIKDGYKTVTEVINVTDELPTKTVLNLTPSTVVHGNDLDYVIENHENCAPTITFNKKVETADGLEIETQKYYMAEQGKDYAFTLSNSTDNFTRVGNVVIHRDGTATNFSTSDYIQLPQLNFGTGDYELIMGFSMEDFNTSTHVHLFRCPTNSFDIAITPKSSGKRYIYVSNNNSSVTTGTQVGILPKKKYLVKVVRTNGIRETYMSEDNGETWVLEGTTADTASYSEAFTIGRPDNTQYTFYGNAYLDDFSLKLGDDETPFTLTHGNVGYNIACKGKVHNYNGLLWGDFDNSCYATIMPKDFSRYSEAFDNWEWVFKIEDYKATTNLAQSIYTQGRDYESGLTIYQAGVLGFRVNNTANSTTVCSLIGTTVLVEGNDYWTRVTYDINEGYKLFLSTDGKEWNIEDSSSAVEKMKWYSSDNWRICENNHTTQYQYPLKGKLNLKESYIKVNGEFWWKGTGSYSIDIGREPNGLAFDSESIVYNFTSSNCIAVQKVPELPISSYELVMKFKTDSFNEGRLIGNLNTNVHSIQLETPINSEPLQLYHPSSSWDWQEINISQIEKNTWYWVKLTYDANDNKVMSYLHKENEDWVKTNEVDVNGCGWNDGIIIGNDQHSEPCSTNTYIDLKESYIKVNDKYYWKPMEKVFDTLPGILDKRYNDTGEATTLKLYDVQAKDRELIVNANRNLTVENPEFIQFDGDIVFPEHTVWRYDTNNDVWVSTSKITVTVNEDNLEQLLVEED